jgi:hypothetical protein
MRHATPRCPRRVKSRPKVFVFFSLFSRAQSFFRSHSKKLKGAWRWRGPRHIIIYDTFFTPAGRSGCGKAQGPIKWTALGVKTKFEATCKMVRSY